MVIILGRSNRFISLRWKLVSTYLLLVFLTLLLLNSFISESLRVNYINEKKVSLLTQSNIISNRIAPYMDQIDNEYIYKMLNEIVKDLSQEINSRVMVSDTNMRIIIDSYDTLEGKILKDEELKSALQGESVAKQQHFEKYGRVMYVTAPIAEQNKILGAVFISSTLKDVYLNIKKTMEKFLTLSLFSLAITGLISFIFADILSSPIERLTDVVKKMTHGKFNQKVEVKGNDELSNLGRAFNIMTTKLEQVDKQRREFVSNVSHEIRTPLSSIKILSESLIHQEKVDEEIYKEFLGDIDSEVDRLNKLIDSLLNLVDLDKEKIDLDYQVTYVNYLIERVLKNLKPIANKKNITLEFREKEKIQIMLDQLKIGQALINIIGNAIKYTPKDGKVLIELSSENNEAIIKVKDNGIGINEKELPFIFDRFYRVDKARNRSTGGTGLGLSITQQIVALHQGRIDVESKEGEGTTIYIMLPFESLI